MSQLRSVVLIPAAGAPPKPFKVWNGSTWVAGTLKVWNGSTWVAGAPNVWNGSAWVP